MATVERGQTAATHEVFNQPPPLESYNVFERGHGAGRGAAPRGSRLGRGRGSRARRALRAAADDPLGRRGEPEPAQAPHPRPLRQPDRRGRVPPRLARADADRDRARPARAALAPAAAGRPRRARRAVHAPRPGRGGGGLPDLDDLLGDPGAANAARAGRRVGAALPVALLRRRAARPRSGQEGGAVRDGHDREAGRLRRARQHHHRPAAERRRAGRRVRDHRTQVVLLGADVRRVPRPRPSRGRPVVLPAPPLHARRRAQPHPPPATQGQARQPLQRLLRGRVPGRLGAARRRGGARRADDHRDGQPHPPRLRDGRGRRHALGHRDGDPPLHLSGGVRQARWSSSR